MPKFEEGSIIINKHTNERYKILGVLGDIRFVEVQGFDSIGVWKASSMEQYGYVEEAPRWEPKDTETIWFIDEKGFVSCDVWGEKECGRDLLKFGNCFSSEKAAQTARERVAKALKG